MDLREEKQRIRREIREQRKRLSGEYCREAGKIIEQKLFRCSFYREAGTILAYMSLPGEPETRGIIAEAVRQGKRVFLPRCTGQHDMEVVPFTGFENLRSGRYGIPEPEGQPAERTFFPDLILVPCIAATRDGARLGHGAGYYDRFLQNAAGIKVCLCFGAFIRKEIPTEPFDIPMDQVIDETQTDPAF